MEEHNADQPTSVPNPAPVCPYGLAMHPEFADCEDELSLAGVWRVMMRQWKVIATAGIFSVIAAAGYLLVATPKYEVEVRILPPEAHHVEALNIPGVSKMSSGEVYSVFLRNLRSNAVRRQFFDENGLLSAFGGANSGAEESVFRKRFNDRMKVKDGAREEKDTFYVTLEGEHAGHLAEWLNGFMGFAAGAAVKEIVAGAEARIENECDTLRKQLEIARERAKQRRLDRIVGLEERLMVLRNATRRENRLAVLDEQIAIARELNINDRNDSLARIMKEQNVGVSVTTVPEPLYLRGVTELVAERETLEKREDEDPFVPGLSETVAEIEMLKARTNDDPFISGLRDREEQLAQLEAGLARLHASGDGVVPARIDRKASEPRAPASPNKARILPLSLVAGLFLGVFAAFQVNTLRQQKA